MKYKTLKDVLEEYRCECCNGLGEFDVPEFISLGNKVNAFKFTCPECKGSGLKYQNLPMHLLDHFKSTETS